MKTLTSLLTSAAALAFSSGTVETVLVSGGVRVNKADFDADQELPEGERQYKAYKGSEEPVASGQASRSEGPEGAEVTAAPSAPDFSDPGGQTALVDEGKQAVAPVGVDPDTWLKKKTGSGKNAKWIIVDSAGEPVEHALVAKDGYDSEKAVDNAISSIPRSPKLTPSA